MDEVEECKCIVRMKGETGGDPGEMEHSVSINAMTHRHAREIRARAPVPSKSNRPCDPIRVANNCT